MISAAVAAVQFAAAALVALAGFAFLAGGVCYLAGALVYRQAQRERATATAAATRRLARAIAEVLSLPAKAGAKPE